MNEEFLKKIDTYQTPKGLLLPKRTKALIDYAINMEESERKAGTFYTYSKVEGEKKDENECSDENVSEDSFKKHCFLKRARGDSDMFYTTYSPRKYHEKGEDLINDVNDIFKEFVEYIIKYVEYKKNVEDKKYSTLESKDTGILKELDNLIEQFTDLRSGKNNVENFRTIIFSETDSGMDFNSMIFTIAKSRSDYLLNPKMDLFNAKKYKEYLQVHFGSEMAILSNCADMAAIKKMLSFRGEKQIQHRKYLNDCIHVISELYRVSNTCCQIIIDKDEYDARHMPGCNKM